VIIKSINFHVVSWSSILLVEETRVPLRKPQNYRM